MTTVVGDGCGLQSLNLLSDTFSGSARHFFRGGYFRKVAYFQSHLRTRAAMTFVYIIKLRKRQENLFRTKLR